MAKAKSVPRAVGRECVSTETATGSGAGCRWQRGIPRASVRAVFGLSFGEFVVIAIVALVVVGPKNLPTMMRTVAQGLARLRRMATDIRVESGIDDALELDGLRAEIQRLRSLTSVETLLEPSPPKASARPVNPTPPREREYPRIGPDSYGAASEDEAPYLEGEAADSKPVEVANGPTTVPALSPMAMRSPAAATSIEPAKD